MIRRNLVRLADRYPDAAFAAFHALPELRPIFIESVGEDPEEPWMGMRPEAFGKMLKEERRKLLFDRLAEFLGGMDEESRGRTMHVLESWCAADGVFRYAMSKRSSTRKLFEALQAAEETRPVFEGSDREKGGDPGRLGESLSPAERSRLYKEALGRIAELSERGQLRFFARALAVWAEEERGE
ncbi:MAG: hypothetical protein JW958_13245 [Candidatus Eisenbacteria bacterium]|nr:hypothetical protein [Candidatus Eisenbacteria bacterium]